MKYLQTILQKPLSPLAFLVTFIMPINIIWQYNQGGWFNFTVPISVFLIVPLIDQVLGSYVHNPNMKEKKTLETQSMYQWVLWIYLPIQTLLLIWGAYTVSHQDLFWFEWVGITFSIGICTGTLGITVAHEFIHRPQKKQRLMGLFLLLQNCYMHFYIDHLKGHHQWVATPRDSATARYGESLYRFYFRSVSSSWLNAWKLEFQRLKKLSRSPWHNLMILFTLLPIFLGFMLYLSWGLSAVLFFFVQSIIGFSLLEIINYVQHYGLLRTEIKPGIFEPIDLHHSWNSHHLLTNCFMFLLQRHSDHHKHQSYPYQLLRHHEKSPQLPAGYGAMILLSLIPILWRKVMDPRVQIYLSQNSDQ